MRRRIRTPRSARRELAALRIRVFEAEETLRALRAGEIDAIVVAGHQGEQIFTLRGEDYNYRVLVETMTEGTVTLLADGTIIYSNLRFAELVQMPLEQTIGAAFQQFVAPEDWLRLEALLANADDCCSKETFLLHTSTGDHVPVQLSLRGIPGTRSGVCAVVTDLTDLMRAEAEIIASLREKELLLREIHHRVKNNLQIVASMLRLQASRHNDDRITGTFRDSQNRIRAMALVHEQLYRSPDLARISVATYLAQMIASVQQSFARLGDKVRLVCEIDPRLVVDIDIAIPLGLIVTELVANSIKHAFPNERPGRISVALNGAEAAIILTVTDDGCGLPPTEELQTLGSLGLQLVAGLATQLNATLRFVRENGTMIELRIPDHQAATAADASPTATPRG